MVFIYSICVFILDLLLVAGESGTCYVYPTSAVVAAGDTAFFNCTATGKASTDQWKLGGNDVEAHSIYQAGSYNRDGTERITRTVAEGYFVDDSVEQQAILIRNKTFLSNAGKYYCNCVNPSSGSSANLVVFEQAFVLTPEVTNGKSVNFTCFVNVNGSSVTSVNLVIKDSSGNITKSLNTSSLMENQLLYSVMANASEEQSYTCHLLLTIDSVLTDIRNVTSSIKWEPVSEVIVVQECGSSKCIVGERVRCKANGNPKPTEVQWWVSLNGSEFELTGNGGEYLVLNRSGKFVYRCQASNTIKNVVYSITSDNLTVEVVERTFFLRVGLPLIFGGLIFVFVAIIIGLCIRKKKIFKISVGGSLEDKSKQQTNKRFTNSRPTIEVSVGESFEDKPMQQTNKGFTNSTPTTAAKSNFRGQEPNKSTQGGDLIVLENDIYDVGLNKKSEQINDTDGHRTDDCAVYSTVNKGLAVC